MKKLFVFLGLILLVFPTIAPCGEEEDYQEYMKMRARAEQSGLEKGVDAPQGFNKDIIIQQLKPQASPGDKPPVPGQEQGTLAFDSRMLLFESGSSRIQEQSMAQLLILAEAIKSRDLNVIPFFFVDGHTCDLGGPVNNGRLAWERANSVVAFLVNKGGVDPGRLVARSFGQNDPAYPNASEYERKLNRRVVIKSGLTAGTTDPMKLVKPPEGAVQAQMKINHGPDLDDCDALDSCD